MGVLYGVLTTAHVWLGGTSGTSPCILGCIPLGFHLEVWRSVEHKVEPKAKAKAGEPGLPIGLKTGAQKIT